MRNLGKYQLIECIAQGGMGEVWKALDRQLQRHVAIKLLHSAMQQDADFIRRFEQEARLVASLHHPNIVKIHNFHVSYPPESDPPLCYMVMDYVQGQTLADYIRSTSRAQQFPSAEDIVSIFTIVGLALDYAHQRGMIHRDIKPANILLDQRIPTARPMGEPILTDFGIARQRNASNGTVAGAVIGTPTYIAPEQAMGRHGDLRSDLYSLGIILYEITTGETPFQAETSLGLVMKHLQESPKAPELINPQISPMLSAVILKSIAKDPNDRFPTAAALTTALAEALDIPLSQQLGDHEEEHKGANPQQLFEVAGDHEEEHRGANSIQRNELRGRDKSGPYSIQAMNCPDMMNHAQLKLQKKWGIGLVSLLLIVLLISGLGMIIFSANQQQEAVIGHIRFIKNGSSSQYNALQIDIDHIPELPQGMAYYLWINPRQEGTIPNRQLSISQQAIHSSPLIFPGVTNLLVPGNLLLISKERTDVPPIVPDTDPSARLYYGTVAANSANILDIKQCPAAGNTCF